MKKTGIALAIAAAALSGRTMAADLPARAAAIAPPPAVAMDWTGFYVGAGLGGEWTNNRWTTLLRAGGIPGTNSNPVDIDQTKLRAALFAGYNWQLNQNWVVGLEAELGHAFGRARQIYGVPGTFAGAYPAGSTDHTDANVKWDGGLRARVGVLLTPSTLLYATGGAAFITPEYFSDCRLATPGWCFGTFSEKHSSTKVGWTLGAGVETRLSRNWTARAEYRHANFGTWSQTFFAAVPADTLQIRTQLRTHTLMLGVAYQFGGGAAPVVAKY